MRKFETLDLGADRKQEVMEIGNKGNNCIPKGGIMEEAKTIKSTEPCNKVMEISKGKILWVCELSSIRAER